MNAPKLSKAFRQEVAKVMKQFEESSLLGTENAIYAGTAASPELLKQYLPIFDQFLSSPNSFKGLLDGDIAQMAAVDMENIPLSPEDDPKLATAYIQRAKVQTLRNIMTQLIALQSDPSFSLPRREDTSLLPQTLHPSPSLPSSSPDVRTAWSEFIAESGRIKENSLETYNSYINEFTDESFVGNKRVSDVTRDDLMRYRSLLEKLPAMRKKLKQYRDKSVAELCKMQIPDSHKLSDRSINERLIKLCGLFSWCHNVKDYHHKDITHGVLLKNVESAERAPFSPDDLSRLFGEKSYRSKSINATYKFWIPLIGLYTGARISEIAQLKPEDIGTRNDIPVLWVAHKVKTKAGKRCIPIHSDLIKIGLIRHAVKMGSAGHTTLFPDLNMNGRRQGDQASKWFTRYRREVGVKDNDELGREKVFHSFRHLFVTYMRQLPPPSPDIGLLQQIIGHEKEIFGATAIYTHEFPIDQCKALVERIDHGLDTDMLRGRWNEINSSRSI